MVDIPIPLPVLAGGVNRDYATIVEDLLRLIPSLAPEWTYTGSDDLGVALLQLQAYLADHLHYHADATLRDTSVATTVYRWLAVEQAEWLGYQAARATPARATLTLTLTAPAPRPISVPRGTKFSATSNGTQVYFETFSAYVFETGTSTLTVEVVEGQTESGKVLGTSTGKPFETFAIPDTSVIFGQDPADLSVFVGSAVYTLVRWPIDATANSNVFWARELRDGRVELRFGDGNYGAQLPAGQAVTATYRKGGGRRGNVPARSITTLNGSLYDTLGNSYTPTVTNTIHSVGGSPEESLESLRRRAPAFYRSQDRLVTLDDYKSFIEALPGIYEAQLVHLGINGVLAYIVQDNVALDSAITPEQNSRWLEAVDAKRMSCDVVSFKQARLVPIDVDLLIHPHVGYQAGPLLVRVKDLFEGTQGILSAQANHLGQHLRLSDMIGRVEAVEGLDYVDVSRYSRRPTLNWISASGNATLDDAGTAITNDTLEQTWRIEMTSATTFKVWGSVHGNQSRPGTLGVQYVTDRADFSFLLKSGTVPMMEGDRGSIQVSRLCWNIQLLPGEFPVIGNLNVSYPNY